MELNTSSPHLLNTQWAQHATKEQAMALSCMQRELYAVIM